MAAFVNIFFEKRVDDLLDLAKLVDRLFTSANLDYRVIGGLAAYLYVEEAEPDAGRLTKDIDIVVRRSDLEKIAAAAQNFGLEYRRVASLDMLVRAGSPSSRRAVHIVSQDSPELGVCRTVRGVRLVPLADLVRMKLTSFRLKDQVHLKDLDEAGLIGSVIEATLSPLLIQRLAQVRAQE